MTRGVEIAGAGGESRDQAEEEEAAAGVLSVAALAGRIGTKWLGRAHVHVASCGSTNDLVAAEARAGAAQGLLITADEQSGGRGRQGRSWHSPPGENLYASVLLRPHRPAHEIAPLTLLVGGALAEAVAGLGFDVRVKWPNDLLLMCPDGRRRKVAGILTEAATEGERVGHVVVGVGLNVGTTAFPEGLSHRATSLRLAGGGRGGDGGARSIPVSRVVVLARVLAALERAYTRFEAEGVTAAIALWEAHADLGRSCRARVDGREITGVMSGVGPDGALLMVEEASGGHRPRQHRIVAGEVVMVGD